MPKGSAFYEEMEAGFRSMRDAFAVERDDLRRLITHLETSAVSVAAAWSGPLSDSIDTGIGAYAAAVDGGPAVIDAAIERLNALIATMRRYADMAAGHERTIGFYVRSRFDGVVLTPEDETALAAARAELEQIDEWWDNLGRNHPQSWETTVSQLITMVDAVAFDGGVVSVPPATEYVQWAGTLAAGGGISFDVIDPTGTLQDTADQLHRDMLDRDNNPLAAIMATVVDVGRQQNIIKANGDWSPDDLRLIAEQPERAATILLQLNDELEWGLDLDEIDALAQQISTNAWMIRGDLPNDWDELEDDVTFGDTFKQKFLGPLSGIAAGVACGFVVGPGTFGTGLAACAVGGGMVARGVGTAANGGSLGDIAGSVLDPQSIAIDAALGYATFGMYRGGSYVLQRVRLPAGATPTTLWADDVAPTSRGYVYESYFDDILPHGYPKIDRFIPDTGEAISLKTMDVHASTYATQPSAISSRVRSYVRALESFDGAPPRQGVVINAGDTQLRTLQIAIPAGASPSQLASFDAAVAYGAQRGVSVEIVVVP